MMSQYATREEYEKALIKADKELTELMTQVDHLLYQAAIVSYQSGADFEWDFPGGGSIELTGGAWEDLSVRVKPEFQHWDSSSC